MSIYQAKRAGPSNMDKISFSPRNRRMNTEEDKKVALIDWEWKPIAL